MRIARLFTAIGTAILMASAQATEGNVQATTDAQGKIAAADCSINWVSDNGGIYCFGNEEIKERFVEDVQQNPPKAQIIWNSDERWHP